MSSYVKSTNFASKDSLAIGNPLKIVKGTEIDAEFNNIATAVATKADIADPAFTGIPLAPTATLGTSNSQLATTAFVQEALRTIYPIGSVYINAGSTTNPATLLGFGTWVAFGAGRVMVGLDGSDTLFDTLEETGGSKDATVVAHTHTITDPGHFHTQPLTGSGIQAVSLSPGAAAQTGSSSTGTNTTGITVNSTGSSGTNANLQPYVVVKMWKRTA